MEEHEGWYREVYLQNDNIINRICEKDDVGIGVFAAVRASDSEAEVSYLVSGEYQRKGYAREALESLILWVRREWQPDRIIAEIHQDNAASRAFIKSLGFYEANGGKMLLKYVMNIE